MGQVNARLFQQSLDVHQCLFCGGFDIVDEFSCGRIDG